VKAVPLVGEASPRAVRHVQVNYRPRAPLWAKLALTTSCQSAISGPNIMA
jgi:hypothetical protein